MPLINRCRVEYQRLELDQETGQWQPGAVKYGDKAILSDDQIANIIFNETRSFSGEQLDEARLAMANAIVNADEIYGESRMSIRRTAPDSITQQISQGEQAILNHIQNTLIPKVREERRNGIDRSNGHLPFGFRDIKNFSGGYKMMMDMARSIDGVIPVESFGPFNNSHPDADQLLGSTGNYIMIFRH